MSDHTYRKTTLWLVLLVSVIGISFSSIFIKLSDAPASVIAMYRLLMTVAIMLPLLPKRTAELKQLLPSDWFYLLLSGLTLGLHFLFWMGSLKYTTVASSTALLTLEPIFVMLGSYLLFKQVTTKGALAGMALAIFGAISISWGDFGLSFAAFRGDVLSLIGTMMGAFHVMFGRRLRAYMTAYIYSFFVFLIAGMLLLFYNLAVHTDLFGYSWRNYGLFLLLAIVPTLLGHLLINWILKYVDATTVSMTILGEPLGSTLLAVLILKESVTWLQLLAGCMLLFGVGVFMRNAPQPAESSSSTENTSMEDAAPEKILQSASRFPSAGEPSETGKEVVL